MQFGYGSASALGAGLRESLVEQLHPANYFFGGPVEAVSNGYFAVWADA